MHVASKFVGAALGAVVVLAGCGGGDAEPLEPEAEAFLANADPEQGAELRELMDGPFAAVASCRVGRPCNLRGSILAKGRGQLMTPGCNPLSVTATGSAILNVSFTGNLQRPGQYFARVNAGSYRFTSTVSDLVCQLPGGGTHTVPGHSESGFLPARTGNVRIVSDGHNVTVIGGRMGSIPAGCTGGDRFTGTVIGLANPMVTLTGSMRCNIAGLNMTVTNSVKLVGVP